jgi:hypothetical protein
MGAITRKYDVKVDCIVTESYIYAPVDLSSCKDVKRVKVVRSLWDTGSSVSLISARVAKVPSDLWPRQDIPFLLILSQAYQGTVAAHRLRFQQR